MKEIVIFLLAMTGAVSTGSFKQDDGILQNNLKLYGWLPTWRFASGTAEVVRHKSSFTSISPFSYEVATSGDIIGSLPLQSKTWNVLASSSMSSGFNIIPTIAWFNGEAMGQVLSATSSRKRHVDSIMALLEKNNFRGIDLDYENRRSSFNEQYKTFISEIANSLHRENRVLYCTAEARTPTEDEKGGVVLSHRTSMPSTYKTLNKYCDIIRIMSYDQRDDDIDLVSVNRDVFYRPVADNVWVEKTLQEALYEVDRKKLILGIPNYGHIYMATTTNGRLIYRYIGAINEDQAKKRSQDYKINPARNSAGELQFSYKKDSLKYWVSFSDSVSLKKKIELAEKFGIVGISIFKFDGTMSDDDWSVIESHIKDNVQ